MAGRAIPAATVGSKILRLLRSVSPKAARAARRLLERVDPLERAALPRRAPVTPGRNSMAAGVIADAIRPPVWAAAAGQVRVLRQTAIMPGVKALMRRLGIPLQQGVVAAARAARLEAVALKARLQEEAAVARAKDQIFPVPVVQTEESFLTGLILSRRQVLVLRLPHWEQRALERPLNRGLRPLPSPRWERRPKVAMSDPAAALQCLFWERRRKVPPPSMGPPLRG